MGLILLKRGKKLDGAMWFREGLYSPAVCGNAGIVLVVRNAGGCCKQSDPVYDGSHGGSFTMYVPVFRKMKKSIKSGKKNGGICHLQRFCRFFIRSGTSLSGGFPKGFPSAWG